MNSGTSDFIEALTTAMEAYVNYITSAIFNIFKYMFCEYNSNGSITGLNLFGSIAIVLLSITLIIVFIRKILEMVTPWHHEDNFITDEEDIIKDPSFISEDEDYKLTHQFYLKERKQEIEKKIKIIRLKEHFKKNKK